MMSYIYYLCAVLCAAGHVLSASKYTFLDEKQKNSLQGLDWDFTEPYVTDNNGAFLSHNLHYEISSSTRAKKLYKRDTDSPGHKITYRLTLGRDEQRTIHVVLEPNNQLYTPKLVIEKRTNNRTNAKKSVLAHCHFTGHIKGDLNSKVALSTCNGLTGMLLTSHTHYFIEPLKGHKANPNQPHPHVIYKATTGSIAQSSPGVLDSKINKEDNSFCSDHSESPDRKDEGETPHRRRKRSYSTEYYVEALVVVDNSMMEYYKNEDINTYIFTIMNMVSILFHDASIGNSVSVNVVRLLLLDDEQEKLEGLSITHHADNTLASFCKWQKSLNPSEPDASHHDVAILITRLDICSRMNEPCSTLGLAQVSGMCQPGRSCNVNEDTGLALAYTIAHELGHNFGMKHDGYTEECSMPSGEKSYIMYPEFLIDAGRPLLWSNCSRDAITKFLDRGWGFCLQDEPEMAYHYPYDDKPPGVLYDVDHQCRLQYGSEASHCDGIEDMCITLWCSVNNRCVSRLEPSAEGTICEWENNTQTGLAIPKKWCFDGECTAINTRPHAIDGGWGEWTQWSECSRSCGGGVSISERHCTNPIPSNGGKYCIGERKKYKICETEACPLDEPDFLQEQCSAYNDKLYKSKLYKWEPVSTINPCQLNCKPTNRYFSVMLNDMVKDGTPCLPGTRNLCITGTCRRVGCDWKLDSNATEDRCGICHGDGTSCKTVKDQFKGQPPGGQGYVEAVVIPAGARNIRVEEVAEANNYLAVKSEGDEYYLNGHWYIQWTGNYNMAGTTVHYERSGNKEGITAPGPIKEPLHIMLLFQSHNPGVKFEYTVPNQNDTSGNRRIPEFQWTFMDWSTCSVSCGGGYQRKKVVCTEKEAGLVEDKHCYNITKPDDKAKSCNMHACPARWWTGPWQHCSVSCGEGGTRRRTVLCVRSLGPEEQMALEDKDCESLVKPKSHQPCKKKPVACPSLWRTGPWSECADVCDVMTREVVCTAPDSSECIEELPPVSTKPCNRGVVCGQWSTGQWSKCSKECGAGVKHRTVECKSGDHCKMAERPIDMEECVGTSRCSADRQRLQSEERQSGHNRFDKNQQKNPESVWTKIWEYMVGENGQDKSLNLKPDSSKVAYNESWHAAEWSQCASTCGSGKKRRKVWCPKEGFCDPKLKPTHIANCTNEPCLSWVAGSWSRCTVSCGGGTQQRNVQCINLETDQAVAGCKESDKPDTQQKCNSETCNTVSAALSSTSAAKCTKDTLNREKCHRLKTGGFCKFKAVLRKCCKFCKT